MKTATEQLIELAERLNPSGVIGDGMVAEFHALAARARVERAARRVIDRPDERRAREYVAAVEASRKSTYPPCYGSEPDEQAFAENDCGSCVVAHPCLDI